MAGNTVKEMTTNFEKLDKFEGHDFRRWQKKMLYVVPTGRVKVPVGRYVVPTGKDKFIVSAGRTKVIPAVVQYCLVYYAYSG
ncbi:hypothetical protein Tco_0862114 [Tanacetum coccineum]